MLKKNYIIVLAVIILIGAIFTVNNTLAGSDKDKFTQPCKIAVVNTRYILQKTKKYAEFVNEMQQQSEKISNELKAIAEEIKKGEKSLNTRVKGSSDYLDIAQKLMEKEANLDAKRQFHKNLLSLKEKQWTETMYEEINKKIADIAKKYEVTVVLDGNDDLSREIPAVSSQELILTIRTRKVLYHSNTIDLTEEVLAAVDSE